jgi:YgiT-type zinc finger domain-containing protein
VKKKKIMAYECPECNTLHKDEQDAIDCCPRTIEEVEAFICGNCGEIYTDEEEAKECCK